MNDKGEIDLKEEKKDKSNKKDKNEKYVMKMKFSRK
jgi:hypothetical protein